MNIEDKKKIVVIGLAVAAGLFASLMVGQHIQGEVARNEEANRVEYEKQISPLKQELQAVRTELEVVKTSSSKQLSQAMEQSKSSPAIIPQSSLAIKTPPGKRAITIQIDSLSAVGGLINPGDYVDILAHLNVPRDSVSSTKNEKNNTDTITAMIFQNVQVLAIGTNLNAQGLYESQQMAKSLNITFALDPEEAGLISFVQDNGRLQLVLRSPSETEARMLQASNWQTLSDYVLEKQGTDISAPKSKALVEPAAEEVKPYIQIFRGGREL